MMGAVTRFAVGDGFAVPSGHRTSTLPYRPLENECSQEGRIIVD